MRYACPFATRTVASLLVVLLAAAGRRARAQDYRALRINEILADNATTGPRDVGDGTPDMVEIVNTGDEELVLGFDDPESSVGLSDTFGPPPEPPGLWTFRRDVTVRPGESVLVYCDANSCQDECEPHAGFRLDADGSEPLTLWAPADGDGERAVIDRVWLPPLESDVAFGRFPDGAGPAPVPVEETFDHFVFVPPGQATFGSCIRIPGTTCGRACGPFERRFCEGDPNGPGGNLPPRVARRDHSTNAPEADQPVSFTVEVRDDKAPVPPNIASVEIVYHVDGGPEQVVPLEFDADSGVFPKLDGLSPEDPGFPARPLDRHSLWDGSIPGQPAGAVVRFHFRVTDKEGLSSTRPRELCDLEVGPCDRNFGGPGCVLDPDSVSCRNPDFDPSTDPPEDEYLLHGVRYVPCDAWLRYVSGYVPPPEIEGLLVNEVVPAQSTVLRDPTSLADSPYCTGERPPDYCCFGSNGEPPPADCGFEDFLELYNASDARIDLTGLGLSDRWFEPRRWRFPEGSFLEPWEYGIVWLDGDGGRCPDPDLPLEERPCFWDCPDPNAPEARRWHASFRLDADGEQVFLTAPEEDGFGIVFGLEFAEVPADEALARCPSGDPAGEFVRRPDPTPRAANNCEAIVERFRRADSTADCTVNLTDAIRTLNWLFVDGAEPSCQDAADADDSGGVDITDAVFTLNWLFLSGDEPPPPGPADPGSDPTQDDLPTCVYPQDC